MDGLLQRGRAHLGAGIVYASDAAAGSAANDVQIIDIPTEINIIARYPIAPVSSSQNDEVAQRFIDFLLSQKGLDIIKRYGFTIIKQ